MREWEKRLKHARDYRDLTVRLGFATAPKDPDPEGGLTPSGPVRRISDKVFWTAW